VFTAALYTLYTRTIRPTFVAVVSHFPLYYALKPQPPALQSWFKTPLDFTDRFSFDMHEGPMCCAPYVALFHKITDVRGEYNKLYKGCANCEKSKPV
jgi:hypothetical protein